MSVFFLLSSMFRLTRCRWQSIQVEFVESALTQVPTSDFICLKTSLGSTVALTEAEPKQQAINVIIRVRFTIFSSLLINDFINMAACYQCIYLFNKFQ